MSQNLEQPPVIQDSPVSESSRLLEACLTLQRRRQIRADLCEWARFVCEDKLWTMAKHHVFMCNKLQEATDGTLVHSKTGRPCRNLMILMPPGAAKSTYSSIIFPPWFIQRFSQTKTECRFLGCSFSADLIETFSRQARGLIASFHKTLGYNLEQGCRSVQEWVTTNKAVYYCAGVGAGLSGRRADCALIDDYLGNEEDANSKLIRDKQWAWYKNDFFPRIKPDGMQVIIANRRHEEDLVGRLLDTEANDWEVIKIPFFAKENDVLGREVGAPLWPEWFTSYQIDKIRKLPARTQAGLYGQEPAPDEGDYFERSGMVTATEEEYSKMLASKPRIYGAGDWAYSTEDGANKTCFGGAALDHNGILWILPDLFWKQAGPKEVISSFTTWLKLHQPLITWSEKGHISKAWGPFLHEYMQQSNCYSYVKEVQPVADKEQRASSIRGRMSMRTVRFPGFASWWPNAMHQMLTFPGGKEDDFVDFIAHLGLGLGMMVRSREPEEQTEEHDINRPQKLDFLWLKKQHRTQQAALGCKWGGR